ncbi:MAG: hypothetical protein QW663_02385, partial [Nitrososphaerota archaeon]
PSIWGKYYEGSRSLDLVWPKTPLLGGWLPSNSPPVFSFRWEYGPYGSWDVYSKPSRKTMLITDKDNHIKEYNSMHGIYTQYSSVDGGALLEWR